MASISLYFLLKILLCDNSSIFVVEIYESHEGCIFYCTYREAFQQIMVPVLPRKARHSKVVIELHGSYQ